MRAESIPPCKYKPGELEYVCFVRGGIGWSHHQGPVLYQYSDGRVVMLWTAYEVHECDNDNVVLYSTSWDEGESWTDPQVFMAAPGANVSHILQVQLRGTDDVLMAYRETNFVGAEVDRATGRVKRWADYGRSRARIVLRRSHDGGRTWDLGRELPTELIVPDHRPPFYGAPEALLQLESGGLLMAACFLPPDRRYPQHFYVAFLLSKDGGETWERTQVLTVPKERGAMEPTVVELEPERLYCLLRNKSGYLYETSSSDGGRTWDEPRRTGIPSPEAMSRLLKLESGRVLLVWNSVYSTSQHPRYPLACAISEDGCRSWSEPRTIATESGMNQLSNFGLVQTKGGRILLATSHYHAVPPTTSDLDIAVFDEDWVERRIR